LKDDLARRLLHGYYACISFIDAQVGRVIGELERLGLRDKTVIVLWGDRARNGKTIWLDGVKPVPASNRKPFDLTGIVTVRETHVPVKQ